MFRILLLLLLLAVALFAGPHLAGNQGYVQIIFGHYSVEMTVVSATLLAVLGYFGLLLLEYLLTRLLSLGSRTRNWFGLRRSNKAHQRTRKGHLALATGDYRQAERLMAASAADSEFPLLNYLGAARAADAQGRDEARDRYLQQAQAHPQGALAAGLLAARLALRNRQPELAISQLTPLLTEHAKHPRLLTLYQRALLAAGRWQELIELLPRLQQLKLLTPDALSQLQHTAYPARFAELAAEGSEALLSYWRALAKPLRQQVALRAACCQQLIRLQAHGEAETLLREGLKQRRDPALLALCGQLQLPDYQPLLNLLQEYGPDQDNEAALLSAQGQLNFLLQRYPLAQQLLEKAVALAPNARDYRLLGQLMERQRLFEKANHYYLAGLQLTA
ncbi:heme biosynthesis HemY N-terminal domain-containing protein [Pseudaeromonas paramecii]|uniref:Heme biosynthesis HemY N-terminal domain-containing protein n=1 Tax=Pseudaeromonas paramecii TaxID=2138166 RepID=A0ABP8Q1H7_9GAMM